MEKREARAYAHCGDGCCGHEHSHEASFGKKMILQMVFSVLIAAAGFLFGHFGFPIASFAAYLAGYLIIGAGILIQAVKNFGKKIFFDENTLMAIATIGAFIIGEYPEAIGVMLFYQVGELVQGYSVNRSKKSIGSLMDIRPDYANLKDGNNVETVSPEQVKVGDLIVVRPGEKIPLDGVVDQGSSFVDTSALTGESVRKTARQGDTVFGGCVNGDGLLVVRVTSTYEDSTVSKILNLIENSDVKKSGSEKFITRFARIYTPAVVLAAIVIGVVPPLFLGGWMHWIYTALLFLVISCPCALVLSVPLTFFCGIGACSKKGILVKGSMYLEQGATLKALAFDKTGTVTEGSFAITRIEPERIGERELLEYAAAAESYSNHPVGQVLKNAFPDIQTGKVTDVSETAGMGVTVRYAGKKVAAGNGKLMQKLGVAIPPSAEAGSVVYVAVDGAYCGRIVISDSVKKGAWESVSRLQGCGIERLAMLTGDNRAAAEDVAAQLGITEYHDSLLPQQKVEIMQKITEQAAGKAAFVGDGINDAPVLKLSPLGIAIGALGSDAAIEASDVVLMNDDIGSIADFVLLAKKTLKTVKINVAFVFAVKLAVMALGVFGFCPMWAAIFADVGVCLLAVLNASLSFRK